MLRFVLFLCALVWALIIGLASLKDGSLDSLRLGGSHHRRLTELPPPVGGEPEGHLARDKPMQTAEEVNGPHYEAPTILDVETQILKNLHLNLCAEESGYPPLRYSHCDPDKPLNIIPFFGGMTNALKMVVLGTIMSFEEGRCFYVDESRSSLNVVKNGTTEGFINKYMETIGLEKDDPFVQQSFKTGKVETRVWNEYWDDLTMRRVYNKMYNLPYLGYENIEGHQLKREIIRRLWRPLPEFREATCQALDQHNLGDEYLAFSVRRGDKSLEKFAFTELKDYIAYAEAQAYRFGGQVPKIFVATDDCTVMKEFRQMRPTWTFVSECDKEEEKQQEQGFALADVKTWDEEQQEAHFKKFFVEIYALALAKVFIGVSYTNVSWWVYFMRPFRHSFILLNKPSHAQDHDVLDNW